MSTELRGLLDEALVLEPNEQISRIEEIRSIQEHSIEEANSDGLFQEWGTYNCFEYALGLTDFPDYVEVKKQNVFANSEFISYLLENNLIEENGGEGVIIYFNSENHPKHAGKFQSNRVRSKWGTGLVFDHVILEAPLSYGSQFVIYRTVDNETMLENFYNYAETKGIQFSSGD